MEDLENVKMMAQDMVELLDNFDLKHSRDLEPDSGEEPVVNLETQSRQINHSLY